MTDSKIPLTSLAGCKWWEIDTQTTCGPIDKSKHTLDYAMDVYEETLSEFESLMKKDSEQQWMRKVAQTGTHSDQVAALVTLTQMSPVLGMHHIKQLLSIAQVKANRIILPAMTALKRSMIEELLPKDRKLIFFSEQKFNSSTTTRATLLLAYFEDFLKKSFATFLQLLFDSQTSPIEALRNMCVEFSFDLLACIQGAGVSGEQEPALLKLLVKSIGDKSEKRVSAKGCLLLKKLAQKRPHLKELIVGEVREQHLIGSMRAAKAAFRKQRPLKKKKTSEEKKTDGDSASAATDYNRGMSLACSFLASFPLNKQDDVFIATKIVKVVSEVVDHILEKKQSRDKGHKLESNAGLSECEARLLRLCLRALETSFAVVGSDCPIPETTNGLLVRLCHETTVPGLSVAILKFLNTLSRELKTDSPKLLRAIYGQIGSIPSYLSSSLPLLLSLLTDSVLEGEGYTKESTKIAFKRRLLQVASSVTEPILPVVLALCEPKKLAQELADESVEVVQEEGKHTGYNPEFWDPVNAGADLEKNLWERFLLRKHYDESVRTAVDALSVEVPKEPPSLCSMLVEVSISELVKKKASPSSLKRKLEEVEIEMPGM